MWTPAVASEDEWQVDESTLRTFYRAREVRRLSIVNETGSLPDDRGLAALVSGDPECERIQTLAIQYGSRLTGLALARKLPNLKVVAVRSRSITGYEDLVSLKGPLTRLIIESDKGGRSLAALPSIATEAVIVCVIRKDDVSHLGQCVRLRRLAVSYWPATDLAALASLRLESIRLDCGKLVTFRGLDCRNLSHIGVHRCRRFAAFDLAQARKVWLDCLGALDYKTLGNIRGMRELRMYGQREIPSLEFVRHCESLEDLTLQTCRVTTRDMRPIIESQSLRMVWAGASLTDEAVKAIAAANPRLTIDNDGIRFPARSS